MNLQTIRTVSQVLNIKEQAVRRAVASGKLEGLKLGNRMLVDLDTAREVLERTERAASIADVHEKTGLTETAIRRGIREGWLPCEKTGKAYAFDLEAVEAAIRQRMTKK